MCVVGGWSFEEYFNIGFLLIFWIAVNVVCALKFESKLYHNKCEQNGIQRTKMITVITITHKLV